MKTIVAGKSNVCRLLGKQRLKDDVLFRKMKYLLQDDCEDGLLLHNVITGKLALLDAAEQKVLNSLPMYRNELMTELIEGYFLVPNDFDEKEIVDKLRSIFVKTNGPKGINGYTILTTTHCNARCFYCYQADYAHINMSKETASRLVSYMIANKGEGELSLAWFGGEPLVGIKRINQICEELSAQGVSFVSSMISNGYLFDEDIVERAISKWKLNTVQISLDGTEEVYNKTKAFVGAADNPYKRVMNNIALLARNGIRVGVRLNLGNHNCDDLRRLIDELRKMRECHGNIGAYVHTLFEGEGYIPTHMDVDARNELYKTLTDLNNEIIDLGLNKHYYDLPELRIHSCMADDKSSVVVYPDGKLFQCEHTAVGDEFGDIYRGIKNVENYNKFFAPAVRKECDDCPLYPSCIILKECEGLSDRNSIVCGYEVSAMTKALAYNHRRYKQTGST